MIKTLIIASATALAISGAITMAVANNSLANHSAGIVGHSMSDSQTGVVDCTNQVWPAIEAYCLAPVSELGKLRDARQIVM